MLETAAMRILLCLALPIFILACTKASPQPPPQNPVAQAKSKSPTAASSQKSEAEALFGRRCATCHGRAGKGDGPMAMALQTKPRNYQDPTWQASVTDEHIKKAILEGGPAVGLSILMPAATDLKKKPKVVDDLVSYIRGLKREGSKK